MKITQILPPLPLRAYIRHFGVIENPHLSSEEKTFRIIADGCPGMIFQETPASFSDKNNLPLPQLFVHGLTTSHSQKTVKGSYRNIVVYFHPHAIKAIFGIDANELTDSYIELNDLVKNNLATQLLNEEDKVKVITEFLCKQLANNRDKEHAKIAYAIEKINTDSEDNLLAIRTALNLSERSLERMFKTHIGISPKLFYRICRFQAALAQVRTGTFSSLTSLAHQHAYADQSHFIREFQEFSGATPKQYLSKANEQLLNFPEWKF